MNRRETKRHRWTANMTLLFVTLVWGATFSLTKGALAHISVFSFLTARFLIATVALVIGALSVPHVRHAFTKKTFVDGSFLGALLFAGYAFQTLGLATTTPAMAGFLTGLNVVMVPLFAYPVLRRAPTGRNWMGAFVAVVGLALLTGVDIRAIGDGDVLVLLCSVFLALQIVFTERYAEKTNALALTTVEIAVLTVLCAITLWFQSLSTTSNPTVILSTRAFTSTIVWVAILVCALPATAFAYFAQTFFQQTTSSAETAIIFSMEPVFAAGIGWLSFHNVLSSSNVVGCVLIFLSMWIADPSIKIRRRKCPDYLNR